MALALPSGTQLQFHLALLATPWLLGPQCPSHVVIATGSQDGAYFAFANRYREILAKRGITLEVRTTAGSVENSRLLRTGSGDVSWALIQGGTATDDAADELESLASLYLEPVWVFCRSDKPIDSLKQLRGKRIAIGPEGLIDFQRNIPSRDIVLLALAANLVARADLHHDLVPLLPHRPLPTSFDKPKVGSEQKRRSTE